MNLNREAFQKIHQVISVQPKRLVMSSWEDEDEFSECGTTRCVAGWAVHFNVDGGGPSDEVKELARNHGLDFDDFSTASLFEQLGANLLGLSTREARTVFYLPNDVARALVRLAARGDDVGFENLLDEYR